MIIKQVSAPNTGDLGQSRYGYANTIMYIIMYVRLYSI